MSAKTILTLGACAATSLMVLGLKRAWGHWSKVHLQFDFPVEQSSVGLFI